MLSPDKFSARKCWRIARKRAIKARLKSNRFHECSASTSTRLTKQVSSSSAVHCSFASNVLDIHFGRCVISVFGFCFFLSLNSRSSFSIFHLRLGGRGEAADIQSRSSTQRQLFKATPFRLLTPRHGYSSSRR